MKIIYGTRGSKLALHQTRHIIELLTNRFDNLEFSERIIKTLGDQITDVPLFQIGGQGLFIKEMENALLERKIDMAVHSLKDVPHKITQGLEIISTGCVEDPRDCFVSVKYPDFMSLPAKAKIGTSSLRRRSQLSNIRNDLTFVDFRGNLDSRLKKLHDGEVDAIILAAAGLKRLGLENNIRHYFSIEEMVPSAGQGLLAIQCRTEDIEKYREYFESISDETSRLRTLTERAFLAQLQGGCKTPMGAHAQPRDGKIILTTFVSDSKGTKTIKKKFSDSCNNAIKLGKMAADELIKEGAKKLTGDDCPAPSVFLVGAGPGEKGLITVKGLQLVQNADVIIYDQLGTAAFLPLARPSCELINVGKYAGNHTVPQDKINQLLVEKAKQNKLVVRLKGGDPFIFGRGGEELLYLKKAGISAEVVPGISSAIAGPCYAGIPVSQRGYTCTMAIVTGHEAQKEHSDINWNALAGIGTLVFLMCVKNLEVISSSLIKAGKPPETPVAVIRNATLPDQKTVLATLETIAQKAKNENITPPAITVVGAVAALKTELEWFEKRPLFGRTIIVTRAKLQAGSLVEKLNILGANTIECPTIKIVQHGFNDEVKSFLNEFDNYEHLVFTSGNGVEGFISALESAEKDLRALAGKKIVCIGPATAKAFKSRGIKPDFIPSSYVAEALLPWFSKLEPTSVAILRAEKARQVLPDKISEMGHSVKVVSIYHTEFENPDAQNAFNAIKHNTADLVTFTSSSTAEGFSNLLKKEGISPQTVKAASIGPVTSETCLNQGFRLTTEATEYDINGLVKAIVKYCQNTS